jgi:hypothetical protein
LEPVLGVAAETSHLVGKCKQFFRQNQPAQFCPPFWTFFYQADQVMKIRNRERHPQSLSLFFIRILPTLAKSLLLMLSDAQTFFRC